MKLLVTISTIYILLKSIGYGIYESKRNNKPGMITIIFLGIFQAVFCNLVIYMLNR